MLLRLSGSLINYFSVIKSSQFKACNDKELILTSCYSR